MTVEEYLDECNIDSLFISEHMPPTEYWRACEVFLDDVADKETEDLSTKQAMWLDKIVESCREKQQELEE